MKTKYKGLILLGGIHLAIPLLFVALYVILPSLKLTFLTDCFFAPIRLYCPGCGGTRAVTELVKLDFVSSFIYNPNPLVWTAVLIYIDIRSLIILIRTGSLERVYFTKTLFIILISVIFVNFLLKNGLMLILGIDLIGDYGAFWNTVFGRI